MEINIRDANQAWERLTGNLVGKAIQTPWGITCALCAEDLEWEECSGCGGEGGHDGHEDDPLWYAPGEMVDCSQCSGEGGHMWGHAKDCPSWCLPMTVFHQPAGGRSQAR